MSMLPLQSVHLVYSLAFSWASFLVSCKIFLLIQSTHLLKINWHFFQLVVCPSQSFELLSEAQFLFLYIAFMCLSPGWPEISKALNTE